MRNLILSVVGAAAVALATPAVAQVHVDVPEVGVHVGDGDRQHRRNQRGYRAQARGDCRQITKRTVRPNGTVVVRKITRC